MTSLVKVRNSRFRKTDNPDDKGYLFDNQIDTAKEVVANLLHNVTRRNHVILAAKMQSGKTGVCNAVINIISQSTLERKMMVNKYFIITGMNDCGLRDQTYQRLCEQVIGANVDNTYIGKRSKKNLSPNKFFVLKNSDLLGYDGELDNSVIFIDEAHYGSNKNNNLTKFLYKHGLDWRNTNDLIKRNIYIISVSATPFDEIVSDKDNCKKIVELKSSDEYVGVSEYINNGLVYNSTNEDIEEEGDIFDYIEEAHERMKSDGVSGVIIIRTRKFNVIKENSYVLNNFDIFEMYSSGKSIDYAKMNEMIERLIRKNKFNSLLSKTNNSIIKDIREIKRIPNKPLLILIKGAFRAGITITEKHKDYIYMVYDNSTKADTTAQALLGRMCGFRDSNAPIEKTHFYINKAYAEMYSNWEKDFQNKEAIPCSKISYKWMPNDYKGKSEIASKCCGNIAISLSNDEIREIYNNRNSKATRVEFMASIMPKILKRHGIKLDYDYIGEAVISGRNHYTPSTRVRRFDSFTESYTPYVFRPSKIKKFLDDKKRDYLIREDLGTTAIYVVLDADIYDNGKIGGKKRLLIYNVEVAQRIIVPNFSSLYKEHKDTSKKEDSNVHALVAV